MMFVSFAFGAGKPACKYIDAESKTVKVFSDNSKTWDEARTFCQSSKVLGVTGDLVTDTDATTHAFLAKQSKLLWLGGSDTVTEGTWKWVTGEAVDMKHISEGGHWAASEPNNGAGGQDCMVMNYDSGDGEQGDGEQWDDQKCDNINGGAKIISCEYHHKRSAKVSNKFLQYFSTPKTFSEAKAECKSNGGLLVVANNDEINSWVAKQGNGKKWIGATDLKSEGTWLWSDGSRVSAESWNHWTGDGPDNADRVEHCATVNADAKWDDNYCKAAHPFVCQFAKTC